MTEMQMQRFKAALEAKRRQFMEYVGAQAAELAIGECEKDTLDQVQAMCRRDQTASVLGLASRTIQEIDCAIEAISQGGYGICLECEDPISIKRLEAIPWAPLCVRCQDRLERQGPIGNGASYRFNMDREAA